MLLGLSRISSGYFEAMNQGNHNVLSSMCDQKTQFSFFGNDEGWHLDRFCRTRLMVHSNIHSVCSLRDFLQSYRSWYDTYCTESGRDATSHPSAARYTYSFTANLEHVLVYTKAIAFSAVKVHDLRIEAPFLHLEILRC